MQEGAWGKGGGDELGAEERVGYERPPGGCEQVGRLPVCLGLSHVNTEHSEKLG